MRRFTLTLPTAKLADSFDGIDGVRRIMEGGAHDVNEVRSTLLGLFGGYTETEGTGGWRDDTGRDHIEPITVWTVDTDRQDAPGRIGWYASWLCERLDEQCVYVTQSWITPELVYGTQHHDFNPDGTPRLDA